MARLLGNTRRRINWGFWIALAVVVAFVGSATTWLSPVFARLFGG